MRACHSKQVVVCSVVTGEMYVCKCSPQNYLLYVHVKCVICSDYSAVICLYTDNILAF